MRTKHSFKYWQWRVIICSMIGYSMFYFVRKNFSFAMPALKEEFGVTNTSFGIILSLVGIIYGVSKFINGFIGDRSNARWHLVIGLSACVLLNFLFGWSAHLSNWITGQSAGPDFINTLVIIMAVLLVLNNIFQGCGFAPCNHLIVHWVPPEELATKMSIWNVSHSLGAGIASVLCGAIVGGMCVNWIPGVASWQWCFWLPAIISGIGVFFIIITFPGTPNSVGLPELPNTKTAIDDDNSSDAFRQFVKKNVLQNPVVWLLAITDLFVYVVRFAVLDWGPTFLQERANPLSPMLAGWTIAIFEISGCIGMLSAGWISDHLFGGRSQQVCLIEMLCTAVCLVILQILPSSTSSVAMLVMLALTGFFIYGPQSLIGVIATNQVTKKASSSAVGLIGLMSYASVIVTGFGLGWFSDHFGWNHLFILMAAFAVVGSFFLFPLWKMKNDGYVHNE